MNWKLVFQLSLVAIVIAFVSVYIDIAGFEMWLWLALFAVYAYILAKRVETNLFLHGFMIGIFNSIWTTLIHYFFFDTYVVTNAESYAQAQNLPEGWDMKTMMLLAGPVVGILSGLVLGLFAWIAGKMMQKQPINS